MKNLKFILGIFALSFLFAACDKQVSEEEDLTMDDVATAEMLSEDYGDEVAARGGGPNGGDCPTITYEQPVGTFPNTMTIDFGTDGCEMPNGRVKKGKIIVAVSASRLTDGATWTATTDDYYVDDAKITGTITHIYHLSNVDGESHVAHNSAIEVLLPSGKTIGWTSQRTRTLTAGAATPLNLTDDVYSITGGAQGVNRLGETYTVTIIQPLVRDMTCAWLTEGIVTRTKSDKTWTLDYGNGDCDRKATVTGPNGATREIILRR
jgi:hypothetical protein